MSANSFDVILYPRSPFLPQIDLRSFYRITEKVEQEIHPAVAIADEIRNLSGLHFQGLQPHLNWIPEKFNIDFAGYNAYFYGLLIPPTLIMALDMVTELSYEETMVRLYRNVKDNPAREYTSFHLDTCRKLARWSDYSPLATAGPIYGHCRFDIFSDNPWYSIGIEAGWRAFSAFAELFEPSAAGQ